MENLRPMVFKRGGKKRTGRGFSVGELKASGLYLKRALKLGLPVDPRRRTIHEDNVKLLKTFLESGKSLSSEPKEVNVEKKAKS